MDTGKIRNNHIFYNGYEGEPEIILYMKDNESLCLHIWGGYFDDIFSSPLLDGQGWQGFTKDYHQFEGAFADEGSEYQLSNIKEYLNDILLYSDKTFRFEESKDVLELIVFFLEVAIELNNAIVMIVN